MFIQKIQTGLFTLIMHAVPVLAYWGAFECFNLRSRASVFHVRKTDAIIE